MSLLAVAAAAAVEVEVAAEAVEAAHAEVAAEVHVPVAAFPLRAEPHARLDRLLGQAREVGRARAVGQAREVARARELGRAKAAAKRHLDLREVAHPVANRLPRDLRAVVHPLRRVQHARRAARSVQARRLDSVQRLAAGRLIALPAAVQPLVN
jgi:hypothetical protein